MRGHYAKLTLSGVPEVNKAWKRHLKPQFSFRNFYRPLQNMSCLLVAQGRYCEATTYYRTHKIRDASLGNETSIHACCRGVVTGRLRPLGVGDEEWNKWDGLKAIFLLL